MSEYWADMPQGVRRRVRERLERFYGFEQWARPEAGNELTARPEPRRYRPEAPEGFVLRSDTDHYSRYRGEDARAYVFEMEGGRAGGGPAVQVVVVRCSSPESARATVMDVLASQMAVRLEPAGSLDIADVAFAPPGEGATFTVFARNSIAVLVQSVGTVPVAVDNFARLASDLA